MSQNFEKLDSSRLPKESIYFFAEIRDSLPKVALQINFSCRKKLL